MVLVLVYMAVVKLQVVVAVEQAQVVVIAFLYLVAHVLSFSIALI